MTLGPKHLQDLQESGLSAATIKASGCRSVALKEAKKRGFTNAPSGGLLFTYPDTEGFERLKPDEPATDKKGRLIKYLTKPDESNRLFIPGSLNRSDLTNCLVPIMIVEGEKKAQKTAQEGFFCIAIAGVWCWKSKGQPISDFDLLSWEDREVFICFDSDGAIKPGVRSAEKELARELHSRGARVRLVRLPGRPDGEKMGVDDYLISEGPDALRTLLKEAQTPFAEAVEEDPVFVDAALAFVDGKVILSQMFLEQRTAEQGKGEDKRTITYPAWTPRLITSDGEILDIPKSETTDREEILHLGEGYYLRQRPDSAPARWGKPSIRAFLSGTTSAPDVSGLYDELVDVWKTWVYLPNETDYHLIVLHVLGSYFFELFPAYPYLHFNGPPDSGKSTNGRLCAALGFNGQFLIDPSEASLFRTIEREKPYLVLDEKENASNRRDADADPGLMALLKAGYQKGARIPRQNTRNVERTEYYSVYSPKAICNVHGLEDILADRSIPIITAEAPAESKIKGIQPDLDSPTWQHLRDRMYLALMHHHQEMRELRDADLGKGLSRLREKELFKPLIDLAYWIDTHRSGGVEPTVSAVTEALTTNRDARTFTRSLTPEAQLCGALLDLLNGANETEVHAGQIEERLSDMSTDPPIWFNERWLGRVLKTLGIVRDRRDYTRKTVTVLEGDEMKQKKLTHYTVRRDRIPVRWQATGGQKEKSPEAA